MSYGKMLASLKKKIKEWVQRLGGRQCLWIIVLLALALGLDGADLGAIGVIPSAPLAWFIYRMPEPERGGQSSRDKNKSGNKEKNSESDNDERLMIKKVRKAGIQPRERLVRDEIPEQQGIWWAVKYVVSVPTNILLMIGSALGYAFFGVVRTFGIEYTQSSYHVSRGIADALLVLLGTGGLAGVWIGGRLSDRLLACGHLKARVWVATASFWCSAVLFFFAFLFQLLWLVALLLFLSTFSLGAVNPPGDSARLDIMHPSLWGRAEAVRTMLRSFGEASAPAVFGWLVGNSTGSASGLRDGFLIMVAPLAIAGSIALITFKTYLPDVAAAAAYADKTRKNSSQKQ